MEKYPTLVYFSSEIPSVYSEGDLSDGEEVLEWLVRLVEGADIEDVTGDMLDKMIMKGKMIEDDTEEIQNLPEFSVGEQFNLVSGKKSSSKVDVIVSGSRATLDIKEKMTTPPTYLTESELISQMEKNGIGTDASIATHIENIQKRYYVELIAGRKMKPSKLGLVLAQGYHLIDNSLVLPEIRSDSK